MSRDCSDGRPDALASAMLALVRDLPGGRTPGGCYVQTFGSGPLTVTLAQDRRGVFLEARVVGVGRVAAFRQGEAGFGTTYFDYCSLPRWAPILEFEVAQAGRR